MTNSRFGMQQNRGNYLEGELRQNVRELGRGDQALLNGQRGHSKLTLRCASVLRFRAVCCRGPSNSNRCLLRCLRLTSRAQSETHGSNQSTDSDRSEAAQNCCLIVRKNTQKNHDAFRLVQNRLSVSQYQIGKSCSSVFDLSSLPTSECRVGQ